jgi:DNA-binding response OmpR family regulator
MANNLSQRRILVVEDDYLIGTFIAEVIEGAGASAIGPVGTQLDAMDALESSGAMLDAAVLDVRLDGSSIGIAERLREMQVPFVFATGNRADIPADYRHYPVCEKPFTPQGLLAKLRLAFEEDSEAVGG